MKFITRNHIVWMVCCLLFMTCAAQSAQTEVKIASLKGDVQTRAGQKGTWLKAQAGKTLAANDEIRCGTNSEAILSWDGSHVVKLNASTQISIKTLSRQGGLATSAMDLAEGSVHARVKKLSAGSKFEIKTPTALAGVRGTDFFVSVDSVKVVEGSVFVSAGGQEIIVEAGFFVVISEPGQAPGEPAPIPPDILKGLKDDFEQLPMARDENDRQDQQAASSPDRGAAEDSAHLDAIDNINDIIDQATQNAIVNQVTETDLLDGMGGADIQLYY